MDFQLSLMSPVERQMWAPLPRIHFSSSMLPQLHAEKRMSLPLLRSAMAIRR